MPHSPQLVLLLAGFLAVVSVLFGFRATRALRVSHKQQEAWPGFVESFTSALSSGLGRFEAFEVSIARSPQILRSGFSEFSEELQSKRLQLCLPKLKASFQNSLVDEFVELLLLNDRFGGVGLVPILKNHARLCRAKNAANSMARAKTSATLTIAKLGVSAPWVLLLLLLARPETAESFDTAGGAALLLGGLATCAVAFRLILIIGKPSVEVRVYGAKG